MKAKTDSSSIELPIETTEGTFVAHYSDRGLAALDFPGANRSRSGRPQIVPPKIRLWHDATVRALESALAGKSPHALPPLDLSRGTEFQQEVWSALCKIAAGETLSYSEVAGKIGRPNAVRAVGGACGANPIPVLVPCHRVLAAHHRLGGFSSDMKWKRALLTREGVQFRA
jgi:methylated-DNA-[protein]-cysteine S-methyltransferase